MNYKLHVYVHTVTTYHNIPVSQGISEHSIQSSADNTTKFQLNTSQGVDVPALAEQGAAQFPVLSSPLLLAVKVTRIPEYSCAPKAPVRYRGNHESGSREINLQPFWVNIAEPPEWGGLSHLKTGGVEANGLYCDSSGFNP
jgi:hypothetical protein